ncbi:MAG: His-Xaa-Ser system protein HxsD [Elusimicrobia bacterium]|nr:His-Xaa-Ser system protein HxsD [Elusimicrobiota bacterium]
MSQEQSQEVEFPVDCGLYPPEAVQAAAYRFTDRAYVRISRPKKGELLVKIKAKDGSLGERAKLSDEFWNELLHQALRQKISSRNRKLRELIVTKALISAREALAPERPEEPCAGLDQDLEREIEALVREIEKSEPGSDPLGVSVAWEQKYGAEPRP